MNIGHFNDFMAARARETYPEPATPGHDSIMAQMIPRILPRLKKPAAILDVGCGHGSALRLFIQAGHKPIGTTYNEKDADALRSTEFFVVTAEQNYLPFEDERFDLVWARHVVEHSVMPFYTLNEFRRVLKPAGLLYVEVPAPGTSCNHETNPNHYSVLGDRMWWSLIDKAGFDIIEGAELRLKTGLGPDIYWSFLCEKKKPGPKGVRTFSAMEIKA